VSGNEEWDDSPPPDRTHEQPVNRLGRGVHALTAAWRRGGRLKWALLAVAAATLGASGVAFAASLDVTSERLTVYTNTLATPTITIDSFVVPAPPMTVGGSAQVSAALSGQTTNAGGGVTYIANTDPLCQTPYPGITPEEVPVSGGAVSDSSLLVYTTAGTYYWEATYSGDGNNRPATSLCTQFVVAQAPSTMLLSAPGSVSVNQPIVATAELHATFGVPLGSITFEVYGPGGCVGPPVSIGPVGVIDLGAGVFGASAAFTTGTPGTYAWAATYTGDTNNAGASIACGAVTTVVNP
jgi:hypothetical protein